MNGQLFSAFLQQKGIGGSSFCLAVLLFTAMPMVGCGKTETGLETLLAQADSADALGRPDWVRFYLEKALLLDPAQPEILARLGNAHMAGFEGSVQKGIDALEKALELQPKNISVRHDLAAAYLFQGRPDQSTRVLAPLAPSAETLVLRAESVMQSDAKAALAMLKKALELAPTGEKPYAEAAEAARILGLWQEMANFAHKARQEQPWDPAPTYAEAFARGQLGETEARNRAQEAFSILKTYTTIQGDTGASALQKLEQIKRLEPHWLGSKTSMDTHKLYLQIRAGLRDEAFRTWDGVAPAFPMKLEEKHQLVVTLMQAGWYTKASLVMASLGLQEAKLPNSVILQAQLDLKLQRFDAMERQLTASMATSNSLASQFYWRGKARQWLGKEALGLADLQEAVRLAPWMTSFRITLAESLLGAGQRQQALVVLDHEMGKGDPAIQAFKKENGWELAP